MGHLQGTVDYSAGSIQPPVFPESSTIEFQRDMPAWLEDNYSNREESSNISYFVANIVFPTPVILNDFLIEMLKVDNGMTFSVPVNSSLPMGFKSKKPASQAVTLSTRFYVPGCDD